MEQRKNMPSFGVLAGGKSSRMGRDKSSLPIGGKTFLKTVLDAGRDFPERLISLSPEQADPGVDAVAVRDEKEHTGPLEGILQILRRTRQDACLIVATDMPFLTEAFLRAFAEQYGGQGNLILTCHGFPEPLCGIYHKDCIPHIEELQAQGMGRPRSLYDRVLTRFLPLEELGFSEKVIRNINSTAEYEEWLGKEASHE